MVLSAQRLWEKGESGETFRRLKSELHWLQYHSPVCHKTGDLELLFLCLTGQKTFCKTFCSFFFFSPVYKRTSPSRLALFQELLFLYCVSINCKTVSGCSVIVWFGANQLHSPLQLHHNTYNLMLGLNKAVGMWQADNAGLFYSQGRAY